MNKLGKYIINVLIAIDQLTNTLCLGDPDETISSRLGKARATSKTAEFFAKIVDALFFWEPKHTVKSIEPDEGKNEV